MRKKILFGLTLLGYCVPYAFLSMYGDAERGTMMLYGVMAAAMGLLCWGTVKLKSVYTLLAGNILSCAVSCLCVSRLQTEKWEWYFKPLSAIQLVIFISVIALAIQAAVWASVSKK